MKTEFKGVKEFRSAIERKMIEVENTDHHTHCLLNDLMQDVIDDIDLYGENESDRLARATNQFDDIISNINTNKQ